MSEQDFECLSLSKKYFWAPVCILHTCIILQEHREDVSHCSYLHMCTSWLPASGSKNVVWIDQIKKIALLCIIISIFPLRKWSERQSSDELIVLWEVIKKAIEFRRYLEIQNCPSNQVAILQPAYLNVHLTYKQKAGPFGSFNLQLCNCYSTTCSEFF